MPVQLPSGLFNAYTEVLDSSPTANRYAKLMERKQAKMDALDEYDKHRINNINPNGVRDIDREGLDQRVAQIQQFYQGNKDKIRKGGSPESYFYEKMFRDVSSYINQSKERTAKQEAAMKLYQERLKQDGRIPDDFITELGENDDGIDQLSGVDKVTGQPRKTQSLDLKKWLSQPKPFNQQTYLKGFGDIKRDKVKYEDIPGQPLKENEITGFGEEALQTIHARSADKFQNSFSFAEQIKTEYADPIARKKMEEVFRGNFGTNPQTMEDYATAFTLEMIQPELVKPIGKRGAIMDKAADIAFKKMEVGQGYKQANIKLAAALGLGSWKDKYQFNSEAIAAGVDKNDATAQGLVDAAKQPDGTLKLDPDVIGLPPYAANLRVDGGDIKYDVTYEGGKKETKSVTRESAQKFMSNKLDLKVVPVPQQKPKQPTGKYPLPKGKPEEIEQGGYKYKWNVKTGKYE